MDTIEKYTFAQRQKAIALFMGLRVKPRRFLFFFTIYDLVVGSNGREINNRVYTTEKKAWSDFCELPWYTKWIHLMPVVEWIEYRSGIDFIISGSTATHGSIQYQRKHKYDAVFLVASDYAINHCIQNKQNFTL